MKKTDPKTGGHVSVFLCNNVESALSGIKRVLPLIRSAQIFVCFILGGNGTASGLPGTICADDTVITNLASRRNRIAPQQVLHECVQNGDVLFRKEHPCTYILPASPDELLSLQFCPNCSVSVFAYQADEAFFSLVKGLPYLVSARYALTPNDVSGFLNQELQCTYAPDGLKIKAKGTTVTLGGVACYRIREEFGPSAELIESALNAIDPAQDSFRLLDQAEGLALLNTISKSYISPIDEIYNGALRLSDQQIQNFLATYSEFFIRAFATHDAILEDSVENYFRYLSCYRKLHKTVESRITSARNTALELADVCSVQELRVVRNQAIDQLQGDVLLIDSGRITGLPEAEILKIRQAQLSVISALVY